MVNSIFEALVKMSLQGIIVIAVILWIRFLLKKIHVSHKYLVWLWFIVFFYLVFPWKLGLPIGFWENGGGMSTLQTFIQEQEYPSREVIKNSQDTEKQTGGRQSNMAARVDTFLEREGVAGDSVQEKGVETEQIKMDRKDSEILLRNLVLPHIWLFVFLGLLVHLLVSYFAMKKKLLLSVPYAENIWWTESISTPMVFGLLNARIYLPLSARQEELVYMITHEKIHIYRKDYWMKMLAYVICLLHWFNPFVWLAYVLLGNDIEGACDEEVIQRIGIEQKKEYAYALLHCISGADSKKKRVFVAPICFNEGNIRSRIENIVKYRYTLPGLGIMVMVLSIVLAALFMTKTQKTEVYAEKEYQEAYEEMTNTEEIIAENMEELPAFYVTDLDTLQIKENHSLKDYYITSRYTCSNYFYIDENGTLWGMGSNEYGQLGISPYGQGEYYEEPVRIAEQVLSVDASWNDYFCIYLTESGELYGMGLNYAGLLLGKGSEETVYSFYEYQKVAQPVLLMSDVAYARAGRECIVALKKDKTAYWWGQYAPTTHSSAKASYTDYWKVEEDSLNPVKMLAIEPIKILENCEYITTGTFHGAAISDKGELYTWGLNIFGECGTAVTKDDFIRTPTKVMDDVKMVWVEKIFLNDPLQNLSEFLRRDLYYSHHTFVLTKDNSLLAAGWGLGDKEKTTEVNGDIVTTEVHLYSDTFVPIQAIEYSESTNRKKLSSLAFGMKLAEVEEILNQAGLYSFLREEEGTSYLCIEDSRYYCYFDKEDSFYSLMIQEGGSRDERFHIGMKPSELEEAVGQAGGILEKKDENLWIYQDAEKQIQYEFRIYKDTLSVLWEKKLP